MSFSLTLDEAAAINQALENDNLNDDEKTGKWSKSLGYTRIEDIPHSSYLEGIKEGKRTYIDIDFKK